MYMWIGALKQFNSRYRDVDIAMILKKWSRPRHKYKKNYFHVQQLRNMIQRWELIVSSVNSQQQWTRRTRIPAQKMLWGSRGTILLPIPCLSLPEHPPRLDCLLERLHWKVTSNKLLNIRRLSNFRSFDVIQIPFHFKRYIGHPWPISRPSVPQNKN